MPEGAEFPQAVALVALPLWVAVELQFITRVAVASKAANIKKEDSNLVPWFVSDFLELTYLFLASLSCTASLLTYPTLGCSGLWRLSSTLMRLLAAWELAL